MMPVISQNINEVASGIMVFLFRNINYFVPLVGYAYSLWPKKTNTKKLSSDNFTFALKSNTEDDEDILSQISED